MSLPKQKDGKPVISYTQFDLWRKNKNEYYRKYFFGIPTPPNAWMELGSRVGQAISAKKFEDDLTFLSKVRRFASCERFVRLDLGWFDFIGYIDSCSATKILEYKTGANIEKYLKDYHQVSLYQAALEAETGKKIKDTLLVLIHTEGNPYKEGLRLKGTFEEVKLETDPEQAIELLKETAAEIAEHYKVYKKIS